MICASVTGCALNNGSKTMADFCKQCSIAIFGDDLRDMSDIATGDSIASVLCEGCGATYVDATGACVNLSCLEKHGTKHADCKEACQQAMQYGVWPESSCSPRCVWQRYGHNPLSSPPSDAEKMRARDEVNAELARAKADLEANLKLNKE